MDYSEGKTEFDLRQSQLELIGALSQEKTLAYRAALHSKQKNNLQNLFRELKTLYTQGIKRFIDVEENEELLQEINDLIEELDKKLGEHPGEENFIYLEDELKTFRQLEDLDELIQKLQMEAGLDIPRKKNYDPEEAGLAGLK